MAIDHAAPCRRKREAAARILRQPPSSSSRVDWRPVDYGLSDRNVYCRKDTAMTAFGFVLGWIMGVLVGIVIGELIKRPGKV